MNLLKKLILNRITLIGLTVFSSIITIFVSLLWNAQLSLIINRLFSYIPLLILLLIGGNQIIQGTTTIGTLYIFINLSGNVSGVMMNMPNRIAGFRRFVANMQRLEPSVLIENGGH